MIRVRTSKYSAGYEFLETGRQWLKNFDNRDRLEKAGSPEQALRGFLVISLVRLGCIIANPQILSLFTV